MDRTELRLNQKNSPKIPLRLDNNFSETLRDFSLPLRDRVKRLRMEAKITYYYKDHKTVFGFFLIQKSKNLSVDEASAKLTKSPKACPEDSRRVQKSKSLNIQISSSPNIQFSISLHQCQAVISISKTKKPNSNII